MTPKDGTANIFRYAETLPDDGCTYVKSSKQKHAYSYRNWTLINGKYLIERTWTGELNKRVSHIDGDERYMMVQYRKGEEKQQRVAESEERVSRA